MGGGLIIALQIIMCVIGTLAFAVTMRAPKRTLKYIAFGSLICSAAERTLSQRTNDFFACFAAMLALCVYCEITARIIKEPTSITLIPSTIPLLPGSAIYYTMLYAVKGDAANTLKYAKATVLAGMGIALGAAVSTAAVKIIAKVKNTAKNN